MVIFQGHFCPRKDQVEISETRGHVFTLLVDFKILPDYF